MNQQQENEEFHQQTIAVLKLVSQHLTTDDLALLCWHCGVRPEEVQDFYPQRKAA